MIFVAQLDPTTGALMQGLGFTSTAGAEAHIAAHPEFNYATVDRFVSPQTHEYVNGTIRAKEGV